MQSIAQTPLTLTTVLQALIVLFVAAPALVTKIVPFLKPRKTRALGPVPEEDWRERRHRRAAAPHTEVARVETPQKRRQRISTGVLIAVVGVLLLIGLASTTGSARFALSDAFDEVQLPTVTVPGFTTVLVCALLCLLGRGWLPVRPDARSVAGVGRSRGRAGCRYGLS